MDKRISAAAAVAQISDGMTVGIGGWGPRRKPMALVREILRSDLKDLTIVAYGGADVGMLCASGKVKKVIFAFVSLDFIPLEPYFRQARQSGADQQPHQGVAAQRPAAGAGVPGTGHGQGNPGQELQGQHQSKEGLSHPVVSASFSTMGFHSMGRPATTSTTRSASWARRRCSRCRKAI